MDSYLCEEEINFETHFSQLNNFENHRKMFE